MKSSENNFETLKGCLSCSIRLQNHVLPNWQQKNKVVFEKNHTFFVGKCRIVPENVKEYVNIHSVAKYQKTRRGFFETLKNFKKKSHSAGKKSKGGL